MKLLGVYSNINGTYIEITPMIIESMKLFKPMLTFAEYFSTQCYTYLIYIGIEYKLQETERRLLEVILEIVS